MIFKNLSYRPSLYEILKTFYYSYFYCKHNSEICLQNLTQRILQIVTKFIILAVILKKKINKKRLHI